MNDNGYYFFELDEKNYLYDFAAGIIAEITPYFMEILTKYNENKICEKTEQELIDSLLSCGLLQKIESTPKPALMENKCAYLSFAPTYKCNFRCSYCFGDHGNAYKGEKREFTQKTLNQMLRYFFEVAYPNAEQYRIDFVSGGEPLLGINIIKMAIDYIESYSEQSGKHISVWLCTNGSLLTNDIIEYLSSHNVSIGISLDGRKEWNDITRLDNKGNGTYDQICKGISLIKRNNNVSNKFKSIWGLCTATNDNCDFVDILKHMKELGFQNVQIRLIRSKEKYNIEKIKEQYHRLSNFLYEEFTKGNLEYLRMILNDNDQYGKVLKRVILNHILIRRCNAGVNKITICPDGAIYPCDSLVGFDNFLLGNINNRKENLNILKNVDQIEHCHSCDIKYLCGGDCYYNSFLKTGNQFLPDPEFCQIQRNIINRTIDMRYKMEKVNKEA